jgi:hypothetical protein
MARNCWPFQHCDPSLAHTPVCYRVTPSGHREPGGGIERGTSWCYPVTYNRQGKKTATTREGAMMTGLCCISELLVHADISTPFRHMCCRQRVVRAFARSIRGNSGAGRRGARVPRQHNPGSGDAKSSMCLRRAVGARLNGCILRCPRSSPVRVERRGFFLKKVHCQDRKT